MKIRVADAELHGLAHQAARPQAAADVVAQRGQAQAAGLLADQVVRKGHAVADTLDLALGIKRAHRLVVLAAGIAQQGIAHFAEHAVHECRVTGGKVTDRMHAQVGKAAGGALAYIEQGVDRQRPHFFFVVLRRKHGGGIRLFVVAAELGERAVKRNADRNGQADLFAHTAAQLVRDLLACAEQVYRPGHIQKGLVDAERVDQVGVLQI